MTSNEKGAKGVAWATHHLSSHASKEEKKAAINKNALTADAERQLSQGNDPANEESVLMSFATETTAHGISKIAKAHSLFKRILWIAALLAALTAAVYLTSLRFIEYYQYNTMIQYEKNTEQAVNFPAVTFCNFNRLTKTYMTGANAKEIELMNNLLSEGGSNSSCQPCTSNETPCRNDMYRCCVPDNWICDGISDCSDDSDEDNCNLLGLQPNFVTMPVITHPISICNESFATITAENGWLQTPDFGSSKYEHDLSCSKTIQFPTPSKTYLILKLWFDVEYEQSCVYDALELLGSTICGAKEVAGVVEVSTLLTVYQDITVNFRSDSSVDDLGFALNWKFSDELEGFQNVTTLAALFDQATTSSNNQTLQALFDVCSGGYIDLGTSSYSGAIIYSPGLLVGEAFPPNLNCMLTIQAGEYPPEVRFLDMGLEDTAGCTSDFIQFGFESFGHNVSERFCGIDGNIHLINTVDALQSIEITFGSGNSSTGTGFAFYIGDNNSLLVEFQEIDYNTNHPYSTQVPELAYSVTLPTNDIPGYGDSTINPTSGARRRKRSVLPTFSIYKIIRHKRNTNNSSSNGTKSTSSAQQQINLGATKFSSMIREGGWQLGDADPSRGVNISTVTLLACKFRGVNCNSSWFQHVFTKFGNCYTFNKHNAVTDEELKGSGIALPLQQIQPGPAHGLTVLFDIQSDEYYENIDYGMSQVGLKFQIHPTSERPDVENKGMAVSSGTHAYAGFSWSRVTNLEPPWGECDKDRKNRYSDVYTYHQCAIECKLSEVILQCGCRPYYYPGDEPECDADELRSCALPTIELLDKGDFAKICQCPVACEYDLIDMELSYADFGTYEYRRIQMNERFYGITNTSVNPKNDSNFYKNNIVSMNIFFTELSITELKQLKSMELSSLFSDLGGQLGLFIGVSVLTVCEMIEAILVGCKRCLARRSAKRIGTEWLTKARAQIVMVASPNEEKENLY